MLLKCTILVLAAVTLSLQPAAPAPVPVVVELFTSEGCSSCPPADAVLSKVTQEASIAGAQVIALGMHVTYWDRLGWKDPASSPLATRRQQDYSRVFGEDRVYTPQAVIDGHEELVGSDESGVRRALAKAAREPHAHLTLTASIDGDILKAGATVTDLPGDAKGPLHAWMVITEDGLTSVVKRGENGGRTLRHDAVVRAISGRAFDRTAALEFRADLRREWRRDRLKAAVLLQDTRTQRIRGAAQIVLK